MGHIAVILEIDGRKIKLDSGGGNIIIGEHYQPVGDDCKPLKTDFLYSSPGMITGSEIVLGFVDLINESKSDEGEKRIYSRKSSGESVAEVWLKKNGDISIKNNNAEILLKENGEINANNNSGFFKLETSGVFNANGATIDSGGNMSVTSLTINGNNFNSHIHSGVTSGTETTGGVVWVMFC